MTPLYNSGILYFLTVGFRDQDFLEKLAGAREDVWAEIADELKRNPSENIENLIHKKRYPKNKMMYFHPDHLGHSGDLFSEHQRKRISDAMRDEYLHVDMNRARPYGSYDPNRGSGSGRGARSGRRYGSPIQVNWRKAAGIAAAGLGGLGAIYAYDRYKMNKFRDTVNQNAGKRPKTKSSPFGKNYAA